MNGEKMEINMKVIGIPMDKDMGLELVFILVEKNM